MLDKSSIFMMLLIVAASLIGIGSAAYHQPEVAVTQPQTPQPPQQLPQQGQIQSPNTAPPTLGKRTSPQGQQSDVGTLVQRVQDKALVDRLFPYIIQKIDGQTLLQKIDAKTLAAKVLPYIKISVVQRDGESSKGGNVHVVRLKAFCDADETVVGGGYSASRGNVWQSKLNYDEYTSKVPVWYWQVVVDVDEKSVKEMNSYTECAKLALK